MRLYGKMFPPRPAPLPAPPPRRCNTREATVETLLGHRTPAQTRRTIGHADNCARCDLLWSIVLDEIREAAR